MDGFLRACHGAGMARGTALLSAAIGAVVVALGLEPHARAGEETFSLHKSADRGASWSQVGQGLPTSARINALAMAGDAAIAATDEGLYVSRDEALSWESPQNGGAGASRALCLATHARGIFAGTRARGVLFSDDHGVSWKPVNTGLTDPWVRSLLATATSLYAGTDSHGVFVSEDFGASWKQVRTGLPEGSQVFNLASLGGTVFAALYSQGLYGWDVARTTWTKTGGVFPLEIVSAGELLVVGHNPGGVFVSSDRGRTWLERSAGLPANAPIWTLAADDDRIVVGTSGKAGFPAEEVGLLTSTDQGESWTRGDIGLPPGSAAVSLVVTKRFILAGVVRQKTRETR